MSRTVAALITLFSLVQVTSGGLTAASAMTKKDYIAAWTAACVHDGRGTKLKLGSAEKSFLAIASSSAIDGYYQGKVMIGGSHPSRSAIKQTTCACMARYVASHKKQIGDATSSNVLSDSLQRCL